MGDSTLAPGRVPLNMGWKNLQKGGKKKGPPPKVGGNLEAIKRAKARDDEVYQIARDDPERAQEELYAELTTTALRLTRKLNRSGGEPSRLLLEALKEVRQAGLVVLEIRRSRGAMQEASQFFVDLDERMARLLDLAGDELGQLEPLADFTKRPAK
jgi:hypothetical protein